MRVFLKSFVAFLAGGMLLTISQANAGIIGVAVDRNNIGGGQVGQTENRPALGGQEAIRYFIPLDPATGDGVYGVDNGGNYGLVADSGNGGPTLSMDLLFTPINPGALYTLDILFEDLDLDGANDPAGFLENIQVFDVIGNPITGLITDIGGAVTGNADTQQLLSVFLGAIMNDPFIVRLNFSASSQSGGTNTAEFLIAEINEIPLPAAVWLFFAGLAGLGFAGRKKTA